MKAIQYNTFGQADVLQKMEVPKPTPLAGQLVVAVEATSVNPIDMVLRSGYFFRERVAFPFTPGWDVVGYVTHAGAEVGRFKEGDRVFGFIPFRGGSSAELALVYENEVAHLPEGIPTPIAAAAPSVAVTAWQALFDAGQLQSGQKVLIHAGAGGVGHVAIQLAKHHGAMVVTTASQRNHSFLYELGADQVIDYNHVDISDVVRDADVVIVSVGGNSTELSYHVLRAGGIYVSLVGPPDFDKCHQLGIHGQQISVQPNHKQLEEVGRMIAAGELQIHIDQIFPLEQLATAHEYVARSHTRGKVVIQL